LSLYKIVTKNFGSGKVLGPSLNYFLLKSCKKTIF